MTSEELKPRWKPELNLDKYIERLVWELYSVGGQHARQLSSSNRPILEAKAEIKQLISDIIDHLVLEADKSSTHYEGKILESAEHALHRIRTNKAKLGL